MRKATLFALVFFAVSAVLGLGVAPAKAASEPKILLKVPMLLTNSIEMLEIVFGAVKAGGVIVPLSAMVQGDALCRMINDSDSRFLFCRKSPVPGA